MAQEPQEQHKSEQALQTANAAVKLGKTMRNFNDAPVSPIAGASGGATVGGGAVGAGEVAGAAGAAAGAGEAAGAAAGAGGLAELAPLALAAL